MRIAVGLLAVGAALAADVSDWGAVTKISKGARVQVTRKNQVVARGGFVAATDAAVTIAATAGEVTVPRPEVAEIGVRKAGKAKWIGLAVGAAAGVVGGAALGKRLANEGGNREGAIAGATAAGAAIGLGMGAASDAGYKRVYAARP